MNFDQFTTDAKIAITKLETYWLSCLSKPISVTKKAISDDDIRIYSKPKSWREHGALAVLANTNVSCVSN